MANKLNELWRDHVRHKENVAQLDKQIKNHKGTKEEKDDLEKARRQAGKLEGKSWNKWKEEKDGDDLDTKGLAWRGP